MWSRPLEQVEVVDTRLLRQMTEEGFVWGRSPDHWERCGMVGRGSDF